MNDGSITFSTALDNSQLEKDLQRTNRKIDSINQKIYQKQREQMPLVGQAKKLVAELDAAKAKLFQMQNASKGTFSADQIKEQNAYVSGLQSQWNTIQGRVEAYDRSIQNARIAIDVETEKAGELSQRLAAAGDNSEKMSIAVKKADNNMANFAKRVRSVVYSALVFTVITQALAKFREWMGKVIKTNTEAEAAIARLKGALLTMVQPLVGVIIPAFSALVSILAKVVTMAAKFTSFLFGKTYDESRKSAEALYDQTEAIEGVGSAAKEASKNLASFDEINQLSNGDSSNAASGSSSSNIAPDFSGDDTGWLADMMSKVTAWQSTAMLLGGIAMIAIGAATGTLLLVISGLMLIGYAAATGEENGALNSWVEALGLDSVEEFVEVAMILGGIALVAIGAAFGNIMAVVAGLALIGAGLYRAYKDGNLAKWADKLGIDLAPQKVGVAVTLAGIALIAIGAAFCNILMILAGGILIAAGISLTDTKEKTLSDWVKKLNLEIVMQWVSVGCLLAGIALVAIGAACCNILMVLAGLGLIYIAAYASDTSEKSIGDWVDSLGLEKVAFWVSKGLELGGMALVCIGAITMNILMIVAGIALLIAGYTVSMNTSEEGSWWASLGLDNAEAAVVKALLIAGAALIAIGAATMNLPLVLAGIALCGVTAFAGYALSKLGATDSGSGSVEYGGRGGGFGGYSTSPYSLSADSIPHLATGAVIPPNREFMAVLGDQKSGTNIEAPLETIVQAFKMALSQGGYGSSGDNVAYLYVGEDVFGKLVYRANNRESNRIGVKLVEGTI